MKKVNTLLFRKALSKFATGITVVTIKSKNTYIGKTVNSFASVSLNPPLVLFSLDKKASSINQFKKSSFLGINILSKKQKKISKNFSNKKSKWNNTKFFITNHNVPMINDCLVNLNCKVKKNIIEGDHIIFICLIDEVLVNDLKSPLIYFDAKYK